MRRERTAASKALIARYVADGRIAERWTVREPVPSAAELVNGSKS